jgi:hypothetical protein
MKNINKIMLVTVMAAGFAVANRASAEDSFMSPRLLENQPRMIAGTNNDPDLAHSQFAQTAPPKTVEQRPSVAVAGSSKNDPDLVHQYAAATGTPKQKDLQPMQFEIAPLK